MAFLKDWSQTKQGFKCRKDLPGTLALGLVFK